MQLHELKYEARKRRHHPQDEAEIKLYQAIYYGSNYPLWDIRHMEVFKNGTVAQFVCKRQLTVLWIDDKKDIPLFPLKVVCIPKDFILENTIRYLHKWLDDLMNTKARENIFSFSAGYNQKVNLQKELKQHNEAIVHNTIRQLTPFLNFVKNHPATDDASCQAAADVAEIIQHIEEYNNNREWSIAFSLVDLRFYQSTSFTPGYYRIDWTVQMSKESFFIEAERKYYPFDPSMHQHYFHYYYSFVDGALFNADGNDPTPFIAGAMDYEKLMTKNLNEIETEIEAY